MLISPILAAPSERPGRDPAGSCLLVGAAELGEGDREADERIAVAGGDRLGAFDHGGGDRVVAGDVPASVDPGPPLRGGGRGRRPRPTGRRTTAATVRCPRTGTARGRRCRSRVAVRPWPGRRDRARAGYRVLEANRARVRRAVRHQCRGRWSGAPRPRGGRRRRAGRAPSRRRTTYGPGSTRPDVPPAPSRRGSALRFGPRRRSARPARPQSGAGTEPRDPRRGRTAGLRAPRRRRRHRPGRRRPGRPRRP